MDKVLSRAEPFQSFWSNGLAWGVYSQSWDAERSPGSRQSKFWAATPLACRKTKGEARSMSLKYYTHGRRDQMKVALTFDDGPNPPRTDQVIKILNSRGARGHFLCFGQMGGALATGGQRIIKSGHVIGNHSYMHHIHVGDFDSRRSRDR